MSEDDIRYDEGAILLDPNGGRERMSLASAVQIVMNRPVLPDRMRYAIVRDDGRPLIRYEDIARIYERKDFPRAPKL
jgi:hypothetical protein